jgi:hypothetical protein
MSINVFTSIYHDTNRRRAAELKVCLEKNKKNKNFNLIVRNSNNRLKFSDFFEDITKHGDDKGVNIICNSDIYFDDTILLTEQILENHVYALNRWDWHPYNDPIHYNMLGSSDVWVFRGIPRGIDGYFFLGNWGCDGRLGYEIVKAGYKLYNPSLSIKTVHFHHVNVHNYDLFNDQVCGPYMGAPACYLYDLKPPVIFTATPGESPETGECDVTDYKA